MTRKFHNAIIAFAVFGLAGAAMASGSHTGGHGNEMSAIGEPAKAATRTVTVDMTDDMRFTPSQITVSKGEAVRFVVKNSGKIKHEMVLGTPEMLKQHYDMMMKMPGTDHAEANQVTVAPGASGELVWRFTQGGQVQFACLQPGHFDAGMKGSVTVK